MQYKNTTQPYFIFIVIVSIMMALPMAATDIYLPALPSMTHVFHASISTLEFTLTAFFLGRVISFLIYGPLIDRYGYWYISLWCIALFTFATLGCVRSETILALNIFRFLQAAFIGAGSIIGRASLSYHLDKTRAVHAILLTSPISLVATGIAPIIGGYLTQIFGWRSSFILMLGIGVMLFGLVFFYFKIDKPQLSRSQHFSSIKQIIKDYVLMLTNKKFIQFLWVSMGVFAIYFGILTESPFVFDRLGYSSAHMGYFYLYLSLVYLAGSMVGRVALKWFSTNIVFNTSLWILLSSMCLLMILPKLSVNLLASFLISILTMSFANGILNPLSTIFGIELYPKKEAAAASLIGLFPMLAAALASKYVHAFSQGALFSLGTFMTIISAVMVIGYYVFSQEKQN